MISVQFSSQLNTSQEGRTVSEATMSLNATFIAASYPSIAQDALNAPFTSSSAFSLVAVALALLVMHRVVKGSRTTLPLPPGPFPIPLVGNVHQLPTENAWELYAEWGEKYSKIGCGLGENT